MARRGRFGRATTGSSNLSSFISGLVQQSISMNERALINAFNDQTMFQGGVPNSGDIESYVNSRVEGLDPNSAEYAYYMNMLETAKRQERGRQAQSAATSFNVSMGDNFNDFYDQISGLLQDGDLSESERQEFESLLTQKTAEYVDIVSGQYKNGAVTYEELLSKTDAAIGLLEGTVQENAIVLRADTIMNREAQSLDNGSISMDEFKTRSQAAFRGLDPESPVSWDLNNKLFTTIWNREIDGQYGKVLAAQDKSTGTKIKRTEAYLEWARGKLADLAASGITGGELYDSIRNNIRDYANTLSGLRVQAGNELYNARLKNTKASQGVLDIYAQQAATYLPTKVSQDLLKMEGGVTLVNLLSVDPFAMVRYFDLNPAAQADFDSALAEYRDNANGLVATARSIGSDMGESLALKQVGTEAARRTAQDTTIEDYEDAFDTKQRLIAEAQGDDFAINIINNEWRKFLQGDVTNTFGKGISPRANAAFSGFISNEAALYQYGVDGIEFDGIGPTFLDIIIPPKGSDEDPRTNSQIEASEAARTSQNSNLLLQGKAVRYIDAAGRGSTIGLRQADQGNGEYIFAEPNKYGKVMPTIRQGIRVVGTNRGSEVAGATWGFYYPDTGVWVEASTGNKFTKPPIQMRNGGAPEYDENGNPVRVTFDIDPKMIGSDGVSLGKDTNGVTFSVSSAAKYKAVEPVQVSEAVAVIGKNVWMTGGPGSIINKQTLDAITYSLDEKQKAEVEAEVAINNERLSRFDVGYGESRLTKESRPSDVTTAFDKFLGSGAVENGQPKYASIIAPGAKPGTWVFKRVNYTDAYDQVSPGVFVRKESATAIGDPKTGAAADESKQVFPKVIDVSGMVDTPAIKPYVDSGVVKVPQTSGSDASGAIQNYFFRNTAVPSINNKDIVASRGGGTGGGASSVPQIQTYTSLMSTQPIVDFRISERASLGTVGTPASGAVIPPTISMPSIPRLGTPALSGAAGDSSRERAATLGRIQTPTISMPSISTPGTAIRGGTR